MRTIALWVAILGATVLPLFYAASAQAQATRTWVSGVGDDANPCRRTAPCKTFAGAISKTATGGIMNCLDPGGFGAITITKSITIDCHEDYGSILVSGTPGVTISAPGGVVILRNVNVDGLLQTGSPGTIGVNITAATAVYIEDCLVEGFSMHGIDDTRSSGGTYLFIRNTITRNNSSVGIRVAASATNSAVLENVHSVGNGYGIAAASQNYVTVSRSVASGNSNAGIEADAGAIDFVDNTEITSNGIGVWAFGTVVLANSNIDSNTTGITGATTSFGNNRIFGNASAGTAPTPDGGVSNTFGQQ